MNNTIHFENYGSKISFTRSWIIIMNATKPSQTGMQLLDMLVGIGWLKIRS